MDTSPAKSAESNAKTIIFIVILSLLCAVILAVLSSALHHPKSVAKELDRSKEMMIAAGILSNQGYFIIADDTGGYVPAHLKEGILVPASVPLTAANEQLLDVYQKRFKPLLTDNKGVIYTFEQAGIDMSSYISSFRKKGYHTQPYKLIYEILSNPVRAADGSLEQHPEGYVIPVNGFGLWDAIYGYLAIAMDGDTVIGISWYDHKETPGLGANIAEEYWQRQFRGKHIFQPNANGNIDFRTAPLGLTVVRGKVNDVLGNSAKAASAVDGMTGATLSGNGVTSAYKDVLAEYRPFLIMLHEKITRL